MASSTIAHRTRPQGGVWQRPLPGVVLLHNGTPTEIERTSAALLYAGPGAVLTGASALRRHGLRSVPSTEAIEVLVPASRHRASARFVVVERTVRPPTPVVLGGFPCADVGRAVVDHCRRLRDLRAVRALSAEAVQRRLCAIETLVEELRQAQRQRTARIRSAMDGVLAGIRSALEAEFRDLLRRGGVPEPQYNVDLLTPAGRFICAPDGWYADAGVATEVDSVEWHATRQGWEDTQARRGRMAAHGITVVPVTHQRMRTDPMGLLEDLKKALATGSQRPPLPLVAVLRSQAA